jgi:hypothetical protein
MRLPKILDRILHRGAPISPETQQEPLGSEYKTIKLNSAAQEATIGIVPAVQGNKPETLRILQTDVREGATTVTTPAPGPAENKG